MDVLAFGFLFLVTAVIWQRLQRAEERLRGLELALAPASEPARIVETPDAPLAPEAEKTAAPTPDIVRFSRTKRARRAPVAPRAKRAWRLPAFSFNFEEVFGRLLPIWAGGITLAVAGFFLVRYSIELGLLTPAVRVLLSFLFGLGLLGAAELAYRQEHRLKDPRVRQALAGAGLATLYAGFLLAGRFYGLIGTAGSFVGLASVTGAALALAGRFGMPAAMFGLIGGFAAPALVGGSEANMPLITLYLALITAGLTLVARRQRWAWLGLAAIGASLGWGGLLLLGTIAPGIDSSAFALYLGVIGLGMPLLAAEADTGRIARLGAAIVAAAQLALLVASGGFDPVNWALYLLLIAAMTAFTWRDAALRAAALFAQATAVLLTLAWPTPDALSFAIVAASILVIAAIRPIGALREGAPDTLDLGALFGVPLGLALVAMAKFGANLDIIDLPLAAGLGAIGTFPIAATLLLRDCDMPDADIWQTALGALGSTLLVAGAIVATPLWMTPIVIALAAVLLALGLRPLGLDALRPLSMAAAVAGVLALSVGGDHSEWFALIGDASDAPLTATLRWASVAAAAFVTVFMANDGPAGRWVQGLGAFAAYGLAAQFLPESGLSAIAAIGAVGASLHPRLRGARNGWLVIAALWALPSMVQWLYETIEAVAPGRWLAATALPPAWDMSYMVAPFIAAAAWIAARAVPSHKRSALIIAAATAAIMLLHTLFKQLLMIDSYDAFVAQGYLERSLWQALLVGLGVSAYALRDRIVPALVAARVFALAALVHFTGFSLWTWNPLWSAQAVGPTPIANLLLAGFGAALGALWLLHKTRFSERLRPWAQGGTMLLIAALCLSLLRQVFAGSMLSDVPIGASEDLLRSLLGIVVAIGFLAWGAYRKSRSWRIGSLVLITLAVLKVFLHDAGGLEGLLRIGSFVALGFSLIGIGWFYSRQLRAVGSGPGSAGGGLSGGAPG